MSKSAAAHLTGAVLILALLSLIGLVLASPPILFFDEPAYAQYARLLRQHGPTAQFLTALPGSAGPLHAFVQILFEPITGSAAIGTRLVNVFLLTLLIAALAGILRRRSATYPWISAASVLMLPAVWVIAGLALTEIPAILVATISLALLLRGLEALEHNQPQLLWFAASAITLAIAAWGRQPYILLAGIPLFLAFLDRRLRVAAIVYLAITLTLTLPLFLLWNGLTPPHDRTYYQKWLAPSHALLSFGYTGLWFYFLAPGYGWMPRKHLLILSVPIAIANFLTGAIALYPFWGLLAPHLPDAANYAYGTGCGTVILTFGATFLVRLLTYLREIRHNLPLASINAGLLFLVASPALIPYQYSARYTAIALPFLILSVEPSRDWSWRTVAAAALGCALGYMSLAGYHHIAD